MNDFWEGCKNFFKVVGAVFKGWLAGLFLYAVFMLFYSLLLGGCQSAGLSGKDAELVERHSRNLGRIEGTANALADTIADSRERLEIITRAGERIGDGIDRLDYLFGEYEREVGRLLDEIDRLRQQIEILEENSGDRVGNPALPYSGVRHEETGLPCEVHIDKPADSAAPEAMSLSLHGGEDYGYTSGYV